MWDILVAVVSIFVIIFLIISYFLLLTWILIVPGMCVFYIIYNKNPKKSYDNAFAWFVYLISSAHSLYLLSSKTDMFPGYFYVVYYFAFIVIIYYLSKNK